MTTSINFTLIDLCLLSAKQLRQRPLTGSLICVCNSCTQLRPNYDEEEEEDEKFKEQLQQWKKTDRDEVHNLLKIVGMLC